MIRKSSLLLAICTLWATLAGAADSAKVLSKDAFLSIVRQHHPLVKTAGIGVKKAGADVSAARGAFDPTLQASVDRKQLNGKLYYSYFNSQVVIPTWYGVDFKAGVDEIIGSYVSSESSLGQMSYAGVKVTPTSLIFDKRRAVLRQAQQMKEMSEAERDLEINDLLYDALAAYWNWVKEYQVYSIISNTVKVNEERMRFVRIDFQQGGRPAIDTTEAMGQLQSFYQQQTAARLAFINAGLELSNYLWTENEIPFGWDEAIVPDSVDLAASLPIPNMEDLVTTARAAHPKLRMIASKTNALEIEKKLKAQYLLPKFSVSANYLNKGWYKVPSDINATLLENNYKLGVDFSMPLLLREARGAYNAAKFKLQEIGYQQDQTTLQIENKVKSYFNEFLALQQQLRQYEQVYASYKTLFNGEKTRFEVGESSLFLLNSRESKLLEASQKLAELRTKCYKSYAALVWATGDLK